MTGFAIAERYAKALFDLGVQEGPEALAALRRSVNDLDAAISTSSELRLAFSNPVISAPEKEQLLVHVLAGITRGEPVDANIIRIINNFCGLLAQKNRLALFGLVTRSFNAMYDAQLGIVRGSLSTAIELDEAHRQSITASLEQSIGHTLELDYQIDPAILGGVTVRLGDRVLDASLRTQLELLRDTIRKGE